MRLCCQLQATKLRHGNRVELPDDRPHRRAAQRLHQSAERVARIRTTQHDHPRHVDAEPSQRERIKAALMIRHDQRLAFATRMLRQMQRQRQRSATRPGGEQLDQRRARQTFPREQRPQPARAQRNDSRVRLPRRRLERANPIRQFPRNRAISQAHARPSRKQQTDSAGKKAVIHGGKINNIRAYTICQMRIGVLSDKSVDAKNRAKLAVRKE
ncbi:MAG: hypothetical protein EXS16_05870 [Gemmataceae bacterium]|nr:hypothetical protein [Gemmataceae bacterium]